MANLLELCSSLPTRNFRKGETILSQGKKDGEILILKTGRIEVRQGDQTVTTNDNPGAVLGEIALLLDRGHSADVIAVEDSEFYVMSDASEQLTADPELYREIARTLARRLTRVTGKVAELLKQLDFERDLSDLEMTILWED